jgi:excinuclease ABC subunit A
MGPEGGRKGGMVLATGTPELVVKNDIGYTAKFLKQLFK